MRTKRLSVVQGGDVAAVDPKLQRLMEICGITEMPPAHTMLIPLERIIISNEALVRPKASFVRNIGLVGIRQPPSIAFVKGTAWDADDAWYEVTVGRRRTKSARLLLASGNARFKTIKCEVYEWNTPRLNAFLALVENEQRSESWIQDVMNLRNLIREGVAMTLDDLKSYGFNARTIKGRLDIALLPDAILDQICTGAVSQDVALQITRLRRTERERLDEVVVQGEDLTADLVKNLLSRQMNQGLVAVHTNLSQVWTTLAGESRVAPLALSSIVPPQPHEIGFNGPPSIALLLKLLHQFELQTQTDPALERAGILTQVLIKELEIVQRSQLPLSRQEGEPLHV